MRQIKFRCYQAANLENYRMTYSDEYSSLLEYVTMHGLDDSHMQFTGLLDKNGKEIYEGDILNKKYENLSVIDGIGIVKMGGGVDSDGYNHKYWYGWKAGDSSLLDVHDEAEIIGNIHENPKLLESK